MEKFFDKLKSYDEKQELLFKRITGVIGGLIAWASYVVLSRVKDGGMSILAIAVFLVMILGRNKIRNETGWNMRQFNIAFAIGLGIGIAAWAAYGLISGEIFE